MYNNSDERSRLIRELPSKPGHYSQSTAMVLLQSSSLSLALSPNNAGTLTAATQSSHSPSGWSHPQGKDPGSTGTPTPFGQTTFRSNDGPSSIPPVQKYSLLELVRIDRKVTAFITVSRLTIICPLSLQSGVDKQLISTIIQENFLVIEEF